MSWNVSSSGWGNAYFSNAKGGLPAKQPLWRALRSAKHGVMWDFCIDGTSVYMNSGSCLAVARSVETGDKLWETPFPHSEYSDCLLSQGLLFLPPFFIEAKSGKIVRDATEEQGIMPLDAGGSALTGDGRFFWYASKDGIDGFHLIEPWTWNSSFIPISFTNYACSAGSPRIYGIDGLKLRAIMAATGDLVWEIPLPAAVNGEPMLPGNALLAVRDRVYLHLNYDTLWCIDGLTGEFIWKKGPNEIPENSTPNASSPPFYFLGSQDRLYMGHRHTGSSFACYSANDGTEVWRIENKQDSRFCTIAGDLLFGVIADVPVAWDRYTGKLVWQAEKGALATVYAAASDNKVIYTTTTSGMYCYEWQEEYISPARPRP